MVGLRAGAAGHQVKGSRSPRSSTPSRGWRRGAVVGARADLAADREPAGVAGRGPGVRPVRSKLTPREWEVLDLLCAGLTVDQIADELVLARDTVRTHVKRLLRKLGAHSQAEAISIANGIRATFAASQGDAPDEL